MDFNLRALTKHDKDLIYNWRNSESIRIHMFNDQPISYDDHCRWFEDILTNHSSYYRLFSCQNRPLGLVSFKNKAQQEQTYLWGFYIGDRTAPKGSGTIMGKLAIEYAFQCLSMKTIFGEVLSSNQKSANFHTKLGFNQTGVISNKLLRNGQWIDILQFELNKEEWMRQKEKDN